MNNIEANKNNIAYWDDYHKNHSKNRSEIVTDDWLHHFNPIIDDARSILDLGCGEGNNTLYLINKGKDVSAADGSISAIHNIRKNFPEVKEAICFDMLETFPYANSSCNLVIADLCLHYFTKEDTIKILKEIRRILTNRGHMIFRVNSSKDVNHGAGEGVLVEPGLYMTEDGRYKRFFDYGDLYSFFNMFDIKYIRDDTMKRYKLEKKVYIGDVRNIK